MGAGMYMQRASKLQSFGVAIQEHNLALNLTENKTKWSQLRQTKFCFSSHLEIPNHVILTFSLPKFPSAVDQFILNFYFITEKSDFIFSFKILNH